MKYALLGLLSLALLLPRAAVALNISAVYPEVAFAGSLVTVIGGPFTDQTRVDLGGKLIVPKTLGNRQLVFIVPELPLGEYALYLRDGAQSSPKTFSLRIEYPPPEINAISPDNLDVCSTSEQRQVRLDGKHIQQGARLLLNGAAVPYVKDGQVLRLSLPQLDSGSYGLQLVNPDGKSSLPHTLWFNDVPVIDSISTGEDFVNYYQLVIKGKNFFHNSVLQVAEYHGDFSDLPPQQRFIPAQGGPAFRGEQSRPQHSESVSYQDCNTLIYNRYPVSGQDLRLVFRVSNPDGKQTPPYEISSP